MLVEIFFTNEGQSFPDEIEIDKILETPHHVIISYSTKQGSIELSPNYSSFIIIQLPRSKKPALFVRNGKVIGKAAVELYIK